MKTRIGVIALAAIVGTALMSTRDSDGANDEQPTSGAQAARSLLQALPENKRTQAQLPFESDERTEWNYVPMQRAGVPLADLDRASAYDYHLPQDLIAQHPVEPRDESRLLVVERDVPRDGSPFRHLRFRDLPDLIAPGDALVLNETRVIPARIRGRKPTGAPAEVLLLRCLSDDERTVAATDLLVPRIGEIIERFPPKRRTSKSLMTLEELEAAADETVARGFGLDDEEFDVDESPRG